jgi:hypothetical protein
LRAAAGRHGDPEDERVERRQERQRQQGGRDQPPIMASAVGAQNTSAASGINARTAAAAVSVIGRNRRTADSMIAVKASCPAARS